MTVSGDRTGLYGGSLERELCDRERLAGTLEQDPAKQEAWLDVFDVADARGYLRTLTPVLLRADTRVTDHEYRGGRAVPVQSVLEAGTVVLVDDRGVPRVRCAPGSPLLSPSCPRVRISKARAGRASTRNGCSWCSRVRRPSVN
ncbi:DUF6777 domain-containing protein [Rhodococcus aetherivorans]